jgi:Ca2+-binding EF-hand superfamily protein
MKPVILIVGAALLFSFTACSTAPKQNSAPISLEEQFRLADINGDGKVSRDEFSALLIEQAFFWMDTNHSGRITKAEFLNSGGTAEAFQEMDRGNKGFLTVADAKASPRAREIMSKPFDEADINGDGYVTWVEFQRYRERAAPYVR